MNHSTSTDIFGSEYAQVQRNREAAIKALAAMPPKPIRKMGPADYAPQETNQRLHICERDKARVLLGARCVRLIESDGPQTTAQIGHSLRVSVQSIQSALNERTDVTRESVNKRSKKTGNTQTVALWSINKCI